MNIFIQYTMRNGVDLFTQMQRESLDDIIKSIKGDTPAETQSKRGNVYEKLWDIIIKFGFYPELPNDTYEHYSGNINTGILSPIHDLETYLKKLSIFSKGKGGASDITLRNKITGAWVFISSKFYSRDSTKSIDGYDVEKILAVATGYKEFSIYLAVNNGQQVQSIVDACTETNAHIKAAITQIIDINDLKICFNNFKLAVSSTGVDDINRKFSNVKIPLILRFHQDLITYKILVQINKKQKELLLGAKARSGKTYCVGGLFIKYFLQYNKLNSLIITPAPTETITQFTDDLFNKFSDFTDMNIIQISTGNDLNNLDEGQRFKANNIIIVSKQLLDGYVGDKRIEAIKNLKLNFIVFDENHFHGTTEMSRELLAAYSVKKTVKLYLTATYAKPLNEWNIPDECRFYWDIEDEQLCKKRDITRLIERHGADVSRFLNEDNKEALLKVYDRMPDLHILTTILDSERYAAIKTAIKDTSYGFSNSTLLCGEYPKEVDDVLRYITGSNKEKDYPKKDLSIFQRIKKQSIKASSRTLLNNNNFTSQLWFLPYGVGLPIKDVSECLLDRMLKNPTLAKYEIKIVNSSAEYSVRDIKAHINKWESDAKEAGRDGLILLAGGQLTLGVTLPLVDIVFLFNDVVSSDRIMQMMYRCMTESEDGTKKIGFVVDLNIARVLNTVINYKISDDVNVEAKLTYIINNNLINIDSDLFIGKVNKTNLVSKLLQIWKADPINNLRTLLKKIEAEIIDLDTQDQRIMNKYFTTIGGKTGLKIKFNEDSNATPLPTGRTITTALNDKINATARNDADELVDDADELVDDADEPADDADEPVLNKNVLNISLTKDVLPFIIPLVCILTIGTSHSDILEMLDVVKTYPHLLSVFQDQSFIWWSHPNIIKLIEDIVKKYIKKDSHIYDMSIQFKLSLQLLLDRPKDLLELINSCLKPKQKEKQENGEVFTPMHLIDEMLDNLDKYYVGEYSRSIFTEKDFKWFDPAVGMGNFPVAVYLRLMDGLVGQIPDRNERQKHIVENMLYMSELNKKNVFICHQIFNINNQFVLNLHEGDTLELDIYQKWDVIEFDVILGNPPYNKGGIRSHTGKQLGEKNDTIWPKFIEQSFEWLKEDGFLIFINPLSWLKKSHQLHYEMLDRYVVWLKLWDNSKSKGEINADIPISLYVVQNTLNTARRKTTIISEMKRKKLITTSVEYLDSQYSIPLAYHSIFTKLRNFIGRDLQLEYKTKTVKSSGKKEIIPDEYALEDMLAIDTYTIKEGRMVKKAIERHPDADKRKLIIANKASFTGAFIDEGILSLTGNHKFYILGDNLEEILKLLSFRIIEIVCNFTKYGQDFLDSEAFTYIPDIRKLDDSPTMTEAKLYELIGLTDEEILEISKINKVTSNNFDSDADDDNGDNGDKYKKVTLIKVKCVARRKQTTTASAISDCENKVITSSNKINEIRDILQQIKNKLSHC